MKPSLVLHQTTAAQVDQFIASPTHSLLLAGPDGIGKGALANYIVSAMLAVDPDKLTTHPNVKRITPDGQSISIEAIRELQKFLQLKTIGTENIRRAIIIEHAQALTTEAQNAYLKLLEEPPSDTLMILTASSPRTLLPTILSRLPVVTVHIPTQPQLDTLLNASTKDETARRQAFFLSGGLPGLLDALLESDETHPLVASVTAAKEILQKNTFERLAMVDGLSKQKESVISVLEALERISEAGINGAAAKRDQTKLKQWYLIRKETLFAREAVGHSANIKLTLSNLFLHLPG